MRRNEEAVGVRKISAKRKNRGAVMVLTAILLLILVGIAALAVDLGQAHMAKQRLHDVCDAAALAAAWALEPSSAANSLAITAGQDIFGANNLSRKTKVLVPSVRPSPDGKTVTVGGEMKLDFGLARVLGSGFQSGVVRASAEAILENIPEFSYAFVPLAVTDWQIQDVQPDRQEHLGTPYWVPGGNESTVVPGNQPGLYPITFGDGVYIPEVYQSMLLGNSAAFSLAAPSSVGSINNDIVQITYDALTARIQNDHHDWISWKAASDVDKATSQRLIIMPVVSYLNRNSVVGFTGFFVDFVTRDPIENTQLFRTNVHGRFVPGIVGRKSMRWMMQFAPDYDQQNLMYRVRLTK